MKTLLSALLASVLSISNTAYADSDSNWTYTETIDLFTDQQSSMLLLLPTQRIGYDAPTSIILRCNSKTKHGLDVIVSSGGYLNDSDISVRYRFGSGVAVTEQWSPAANGKAAFAKDMTFAKRLLWGEDIIFEVTDYSGETAISKFKNNVHPKMKYFINGCMTDKELQEKRKQQLAIEKRIKEEAEARKSKEALLEKLGFHEAVQKCWVVDLGNPASLITIVLSVELTPEGKVKPGSIRLVASTGSSEAVTQYAFQSAKRAIMRCPLRRDGYDLPAEEYELWKYIEITFRPEFLH